MRVTEVQIHPATQKDHSRLLGYAKVVLDYSFAVRDIRLVQLDSGNILCAMPCRKAYSRCPCGWKNDFAARYCSGCGNKMPENKEFLIEEGGRNRPIEYDNGRPRPALDLAYPVTREFRKELDTAIIEAFNREKRYDKEAKEILQTIDEPDFD